MPPRQYFTRMGSILLVALFATDWCFPVPVHAPHAEIPPNQRTNLRIHSDHKWPDKVVFVTTPRRLSPVADVIGEPDVKPGPSIAQARQRTPLDAFAAVVPAALPSTDRRPR